MMLHGPDIKITEDMIPDVTKQPELIKEAETAGQILGQRLRAGNNRQQTTQAMQQKLMAMFGASV